jgi:hypothetical protein
MILQSLVLLISLVHAASAVRIGNIQINPSANAKKCVEAQGNMNVNGAPVQIGDCNGSTGQQWTFAGGQIKIDKWNKCIDVTNGKNVDGTRLQIWECSSSHRNPNQ